MQEIKYRGNYIQVTEENINGHIYERVKLRKGVQIIPLNEEKKVLLIHEKRNHEITSRWKLVSGWIDKENKNILEHAQEELAEEIGYTADNWNEIYNNDYDDLTVSPSTYYFVCNNLKKLKNPPVDPDSGEIISYAWFSFEEIFQMILDKKIIPSDAILVVLTYLYKNK